MPMPVFPLLAPLPRVPRPTLVAVLLAAAAACGPGGATTVPGALHLADRLEDARVQSAPVPEAARREMRWEFTDGAGPWTAAATADAAQLADMELQQGDEGLLLTLASSVQQPGAMLVGGIAVSLPDLAFADWDRLLVEARTTDTFFGITAGFNLGTAGSLPGQMDFFFSLDEAPPMFNDGSRQLYSIPLAIGEGAAPPERLDSVGVFVAGTIGQTVEISSITLIPRGAEFAEDFGTRPVTLDHVARTSLFAHAPAELTWSLDVPEGGRLDTALATLPGASVEYRVTVRDDNGDRVLLEEPITQAETWHQRSVSLERYAGRRIDLVLSANTDQEGALAIWGAPVVSGRDRRAPDVLFYVIDGGGADFMSVYGYNRRTTPFLEALASEGVVFERAHSNATWTQPSTASFMTSLQHSVLGGLRRGSHSTPIPANAVTMAEHMRRGGYVTASFTSNPNAGKVIGLQRGMDVMRDTEPGHHSASSRDLHERFWRLREDYPAAPLWVHFQTTDVHEPNEPIAPYAGLWVTPEDRRRIGEWEQRLFEVAFEDFGTTSISEFYRRAMEEAEIDARSYYEIRRSLYDETMAFQDEQLRRFVARLKAEGRWENTLLVIGSDHGHPAGSFARFGRGLFDPQPDPWEGALFDSYSTRVPLIFVWPAGIPGGQRFEQPVSMIDVLPTILDLAGLPAPAVLQGRSLAPLMLGDPDWEPTPVFLDEFRVDSDTGGMIGNLEIIDGRWGASLQIGPTEEENAMATGRHAIPAGGRWAMVHPFFPDAPRLLLYDLWNDPFATRNVNAEHPDLVEHYRDLLFRQWDAHVALAQQFAGVDQVELAPEQLEQLRALGYIR